MQEVQWALHTRYARLRDRSAQCQRHRWHRKSSLRLISLVPIASRLALASGTASKGASRCYCTCFLPLCTRLDRGRWPRLINSINRWRWHIDIRLDLGCCSDCSAAATSYVVCCSACEEARAGQEGSHQKGSHLHHLYFVSDLLCRCDNAKLATRRHHHLHVPLSDASRHSLLPDGTDTATYASFCRPISTSTINRVDDQRLSQ